jgi:lipopolysaccharide biosynthesis glycosyltransferase
MLPDGLPHTRYCIATVVSPGFERYLEDMLCSLYRHNDYKTARLVIFMVGNSAASERIAAKFGATVIHCRNVVPTSVSIKSILYAAARVVDADYFLCLDADMLILTDLAPLFAALEIAPEGAIFACREGNYQGSNSLANAIRYVYRGHLPDIARILGKSNGEAEYALVVNDGIFAGSRLALLALDGAMRAMPQAIKWVDEGHRFCWWRNQFIFNLALATLRCGVELDDLYNVQLHVQRVERSPEKGQENSKIMPLWRGSPVRILHFCGTGRRQHEQWRTLSGEGR